MPLRFPIVLGLSFVCLPTPAWANFETGMDGYQRGHYATALREWRPFTERETQVRNVTSVCCMRKAGGDPGRCLGTAVG